MAKNLDFKMRLQGDNASAKKAINEVKQDLSSVAKTEVKPRMNFSDFAKASVEMQSMGLAAGKLADTLNKVTVNSGKASQALVQAFDAKSPEKLISALERGTSSLNRMKDGAKISGAELSAGLGKALPVIQSLEARSKSLQTTLNNMRMSGASTQQITAIEQELFKIDAQAKRASAAFQQFGLAANGAMQRADASIKSANGSVSGLTQNLTRSQSAFAKMQQDVAGINAKMTPMQGSINSIGGGLARLAIPAALISSVGILGKELLNVEMASQRIQNVFRHSFGDTAKIEMQYVSDLARELGVNFESLREAYGKFSVSAREANISVLDTKAVFEGVAKASTSLGLSAEEADGMYLALSQMASKGTVQMEELRGQLGERLPGALSLAAKAMGVSTAELEKLTKAGLSSAEFLPKFAKVLNETFSESASANASSLTAEMNRLKQSWLELKESLSGGVFADFAAGSINVLNYWVKQVDNAAGAMRDAFKTPAEQAAENAAISTAAFSKHTQDLSEKKKEAEKKALEDTKKRFEESYKAAEAAANKTVELQKQYSQTGDEQVKIALMNAQAAEDAAFKSAETARAAWEATGQAAEKELEKLPTQVALASAAFDKFGLDVNAAMGRVSTATQTAIDDFNGLVVAVDRVNGTAEEKSRALSQAFSKMINGAKTQADFEAIRAKIEQMGRQGMLSASDMRAALDSVSERAGKLAGETDKVTQAFERMGLKTNEELAKAADQAQSDYELIKQSGKASAETIESAYKQAAEAAKRSGEESRIAWADNEKASLGVKTANEDLASSYSSVGTEAENYGQKADEAHQRAGGNADYVIKQNRRIADSYREIADAQKTRNDNPYNENYGKLQNHEPMKSGSSGLKFEKSTYTQAYNQAAQLGLQGEEISEYIRKSLEIGAQKLSIAKTKDATWANSVGQWRSSDVPMEFGGGKGIYELGSTELQKFAEQTLSTRRMQEQTQAINAQMMKQVPMPTQEVGKSVNLNLQLGSKTLNSTVNGADINVLNDLVASLQRANALKG